MDKYDFNVACKKIKIRVESQTIQVILGDRKKVANG